jgi:hypothetical protein
VSLPCVLGKIRRQSVVPYSVQVKLSCGLIRASLVTTFSPQPGSEGAYQSDAYFMIRCAPRIMSNLAKGRCET